jgi:hypothetical protein
LAIDQPPGIVTESLIRTQRRRREPVAAFADGNSEAESFSGVFRRDERA